MQRFVDSIWKIGIVLRTKRHEENVSQVPSLVSLPNFGFEGLVCCTSHLSSHWAFFSTPVAQCRASSIREFYPYFNLMNLCSDCCCTSRWLHLSPGLAQPRRATGPLRPAESLEEYDALEEGQTRVLDSPLTC